MHYLETEKAQAVLFFGDDRVSKELLYPEFEAILDGFAPLGDFAGSTQKAVYVEFDHKFVPSAAVFFILDFDPQGAVSASWNLPLVDMARTASKGPDLGNGPIRLACRSQSPVAYFRDWLWDPDLRTTSNHLIQIKKALRRNRLGLHFKAVDVEPPNLASNGDNRQAEQQLARQYQQELRDQMAQLMKEQRLRIATMTSEKESELKELRLEHLRKLEALQADMDEREARIVDLEARNRDLKQTIEGQVQKIEGLREYFEHKLERAQGTSDSQYIETLKRQYEAESEARVQSAILELNELIKIKEFELAYHNQHAKEQHEEVRKLREENRQLIDNSGDHLLENLSRKGVNFVTYQPGAGHITIPYTDVPRFVENPGAFTAAYCGVSEKHYQLWLAHYQAPVCRAADEQGEMCCAGLQRVANPEQFVPGESDRCEMHRSSSGQ